MAGLTVSVVIPTYNRAALLSRAIDSALRAVEPGDEVLVVDDGSTDDTATVIGRYGDRIRYIQAPHGGAGATRNRGVQEARNDLVAFLDSDDEWLPDKIMLQRRIMDARPDVMFCFSDFAVRDRSGQHHGRYLRQWHRDPRSWDEILGAGTRYSTLGPLPARRHDFAVHVGDLYPALMARLYIGTFTLIFRRVLPGGPPRFPGDLPTYEDWQFFGELARKGPGAYLDCETAIQHGHSMPRLTDANALVQAETRLILLERVWGSDPAYLVRHGDEYRETLREQQEFRRFYAAKELLKAGRMREARAAFASIARCPARYRCLLHLPGSAIRSAVWAIRRLRAFLPAH